MGWLDSFTSGAKKGDATALRNEKHRTGNTTKGEKKTKKDAEKVNSDIKTDVAKKKAAGKKQKFGKGGDYLIGNKVNVSKKQLDASPHKTVGEYLKAWKKADGKRPVGPKAEKPKPVTGTAKSSAPNKQETNTDKQSNARNNIIAKKKEADSVGLTPKQVAAGKALAAGGVKNKTNITGNGPKSQGKLNAEKLAAKNKAKVASKNTDYQAKQDAMKNRKKVKPNSNEAYQAVLKQNKK
jgi:hypothetical protein